ncbi:MAG TPA: hypothetical protein IAC01_02660 [Candidatus Limicola stercorigallinarum]|nr:hypothetical protein [Candidatus Limicola stercorigallinarum]
MEDDVRQSSTDRYAVSQAYRWKAERDKARQELMKAQARLIPEGIEWPKYDTGGLVSIGDDVVGPDYGESIHVDEITFHANGFTLREKTGLDHWYENNDRFKRPAVPVADGGGCCEPGTYRCQERAFTCDSCGHTVFVDKCMVDEIRYLRAKGIRTLNCCCGHGGKAEPFIIVNEDDERRMLNMGYERLVNEFGSTYFIPKSSCPPKVLAADGEPLEVGQTVYEVDGTGHAFKVVSIRHGIEGTIQPTVVTCDEGDGTSSHFLPSALTHQRPVLDADGVPIELGDDLYSVEGGLKLHVSNIDRVSCMIATSAMFALDKWADPSMFTHTKPEIDSWERIEADAMVDAKRYCETRGISPEYPKHNGKAKCEDLVRRAKKLAGVGE